MSQVDNWQGSILDRGDLVSAHLAGEPGAFPELLEIYRKPLWGFLTRLGVSVQHCDDLFQEIFLRVHLHAAAFDPTRRLSIWIFSIARNTAYSYFRKYQMQVELSEELASEQPPTEQSIQNLLQNALEIKEELQFVKYAIGQLPLNQREALLLTSIQGLDQQAVAEIMKVPVNTVKTLLRRARLGLSQLLVKREQEQAQVLSVGGSL